MKVYPKKFPLLCFRSFIVARVTFPMLEINFPIGSKRGENLGGFANAFLDKVNALKSHSSRRALLSKFPLHITRGSLSSPALTISSIPAIARASSSMVDASIASSWRATSSGTAPTSPRRSSEGALVQIRSQSESPYVPAVTFSCLRKFAIRPLAFFRRGTWSVRRAFRRSE